MVIGSQKPWIEAILLFLGAGHVTTMDYASIENSISNLTTILPLDLTQMYIKGVRFDGVISFSSLEHSGLGRYEHASFFHRTVDFSYNYTF